MRYFSILALLLWATSALAQLPLTGAGPNVPGGGFMPPQVGGVNATIYADFTTEGGSNQYWSPPGKQRTGFAAWLTSIGGTFSRASAATYLQAGVVKTAAANVARFPTDISSAPLGIRLTGAATNLATQSQTFDVAWSPVNTIVAASVVIAPDGVTTASTLTENTVNGGHNIQYPSASYTSGLTYTMSVFAKANTRTQFMLYGLNAGGAVATGFDLAAGTIFQPPSTTPPVSSSMVPMANGWYLCSVTFTATATATGPPVALYLISGGQFSYLGDGVSNLYIWGGQFTQTSFQADYIPTTTATVTQAADSFSVPFATTTASTLTLLAKTLSLDRAVTGDGIMGDGGSWYMEVINQTAYQANTTSVIGFTVTNMLATNKFVVSGSATGRVITANGAVANTDTNGLTAGPATTMFLGSGAVTPAPGNYATWGLWNTIAATAAQAQALSTLP